jgi:hypothetical protein
MDTSPYTAADRWSRMNERRQALERALASAHATGHEPGECLQQASETLRQAREVLTAAARRAQSTVELLQSIENRAEPS